jgi:hypothetical protein
MSWVDVDSLVQSDSLVRSDSLIPVHVSGNLEAWLWGGGLAVFVLKWTHNTEYSSVIRLHSADVKSCFGRVLRT